MPRMRPGRPSPAMVIACIALFISLGGTGYAAYKIPRSSVGTRELKSSAVTASKIKRGAVTSARVRDHTLTKRDLSRTLQRTLRGPQGIKGDKGDKGDPGSVIGTGAGGDLVGSYPSPLIGAGRVNGSKIADGSITPSKVAALPAAFVTQTGEPTFANDAVVPVSFNNVIHDRAGMFDAGQPDRLCARVDGVYLVVGGVNWKPVGPLSGMADDRFLSLRHSAQPVPLLFGTSSQVKASGDLVRYTQHGVTGVDRFAAGECAFLYAGQSSGLPLALKAQTRYRGTESAHLTMTWLGP